jgi:hypothetical protein
VGFGFPVTALPHDLGYFVGYLETDPGKFFRNYKAQ